MENWEIKKIDLTLERQISTGMIVSTKFLREISRLWKPSYIQSSLCKTVGTWCLEYFEQYQKAPVQHIRDIYDIRRSQNGIDRESMRLIGEFLKSLSDKYEGDGDFNDQYLLDKTAVYFRERALKGLALEIQQMADAGALAEAELAVGNYKKTAQVMSLGVNPLVDKDFIIRCFEIEDEQDESQVMVSLPGDLGKLVGDLHRDEFVAIAGPSKRGKSWALQYLAIEALWQGRRVAFFSMGDMTAEQIGRRIHKALAGLPSKPGVYTFPVLDCRKNKLGCPKSATKVEGNGEYRFCTKCRGTPDFEYILATEDTKRSGITWRRALKKGEAVSRMVRGQLKLHDWPRGVGKMSDITNMLALWETFDDFIPDVIITDYADIICGERFREEERHRINEIWEAHDALAKTRHCLVVTGTHTTRDSYVKNRISPKDLSEDIRKSAHVSLMLSLNQTPQEKDQSTMRVGILYGRHEGYSINQDCLILQQLDCGQFCIDALLVKDGWQKGK